MKVKSDNVIYTIKINLNASGKTDHSFPTYYFYKVNILTMSFCILHVLAKY